MRKGFILLLIIMLAVTLTVAGCSPDAPAPAEEKLKVGFVYVGPIGDGGWTYAHEQGRQYLVNELGVEAIYKESVPEDQDSEKVMRDMIDQGAKVIFATSFGYMDHVKKVAEENPDVTFLHCSGYLSGDNFGNYFGRMYQARYLSGLVAGLKTETNKIGYVAAFDIPEVVRGINAFTLGVRAVNPDAVVKVRWTNTWYDPSTEKNAAIALLDEGVDVIAQHQDTAGPQLAAEERGVFSVGYNTNMYDMAPKAHMTAPVWNWGPYYASQVKAVMDGTWKSEAYWGSMSDGIVDLAPLSDVAPEGAKEAVEKAKADILAGNLYIFEGPIKDQSGEIKVPAGTKMTDEEMLSMQWFVEGVEGKIGQ